MTNPIGAEDKDTLWINDSGTWREFPYFDYFRINKKQNQMSEFEVQLYDVSTAQKAYFKEQAEVLFFCGETMVLKGRIQTIEYKSAYEVLAQGYGMEVKLLDKQFIVSGENRIQYDNTSAQTIITEINSDILTTASSGIFSTDYGNISMRYEYANRLNVLGKTADAIDYYWWVSQTSTNTYSANYLNVASNQGSTSSVKTFDLTNNATLIAQNRDTTNLVNYVHALGYGDGVNQLSTYAYAASTQSSFLSANISATDSTISCSSIPFNATGSVRIAKEVVNYAGTSSTALTGCTRGIILSAQAHNKMCYIEQYYPTSSAQTGSSIKLYGVMDHTLIDKTIIDEKTLEVIASGYLSDRKSPIQIIKVTSDEPLTDAVLNIGDNVTITSSEANIDGSYRIVSQGFADNYGSLEMNTEVSNRSLEFIEQMQKSKEESDSMAKYMQGATNIYAIAETENLDYEEPLDLTFYIPSEAIAINSVKLNFKQKDWKGFDPGGGVEVDPIFTAWDKDHADLISIGTNSHATIDIHLTNSSNPHSVTKSQVGLSAVENTALSTWTGSTNITTLGTISTGVWNATALAWAKVSKSGSNLNEIATRSHTVLSDIGTNTHTQIDTHITDDVIKTTANVQAVSVGGDATGTVGSIQIDHVNIASIGTNTHAQIDTHITTYGTHDHSASDPTQVSHANLTGVTSDLHHAQSHTIVSHSDTTGTGAELDELTDGSETILHTHAGTGAHASSHEVGGADLVSHDSLTGFVANEHIDHTGVSITAGTGMTGGGTIAATRTLNCSITQYTDSLARASISETVTGLTYTSATGVLSLTAGYVIPTTTQETNWGTAYTHSQDNTQAHSDYMLNTGDTATGNYAFDTDTLFIDAANNRIGIGTASPTTRLEVFGNPSIYGSSVGTFTVNANDEVKVIVRADNEDNRGLVGTTTNHPLRFLTNNSIRMSISASGDVGITGTLDAATVNTGAGDMEVNTIAAYLGNQNLRTTDSPTFLRATMSQATGTAPFTVSSTTKVTNLQADYLDGYHGAQASTASTYACRNSSGDINTRLFRSEYDTTNATCNFIMTQIDTATNNYIRPSTKAQLIASLNLMTKAGGTFSSHVYAADHGTAATDMIVNVCYGTGAAPTANTTTIGTLFIKYTA